MLVWLVVAENVGVVEVLLVAVDVVVVTKCIIEDKDAGLCGGCSGCRVYAGCSGCGCYKVIIVAKCTFASSSKKT